MSLQQEYAAPAPVETTTTGMPPQVVLPPSESPVAPSLNPLTDGAVPVATAARAGYDSWVLSSADEAEAGGILQGSWLIATTPDRPRDGETVILLRVVSSTETDAASGPDDSGYRSYTAQVAGAFYLDDGAIRFAAELDTLAPASRYIVASPSPAALSWIASFSSTGNADGRIPLGNVRFTSARAAAAARGRDQAEVSIDVTDFIGRRTAVFGITRSGKSSTIKTLCTSVRRHAAINGLSIGQIIFDPQGEYASVNDQDGTALSQIGDPEHVRIYQSRPSQDPRAKRLLMDFYDPARCAAAWNLACVAMGAENDSHSFNPDAMHEPNRVEQPEAWKDWSRGMVGLYGLLHEAGFEGAFPSEYGFFFHFSSDGAVAYNTKQKQNGRPDLCLTAAQGEPSYWFARTPAHCASLLDWLRAQLRTVEDARASGQENLGKHILSLLDAEGGWADRSTPFGRMLALTTLTATETRSRGTAALADARDLHDPLSDHDVLAEVWDDMQAGRLVIIDLSIGSASVVRAISERIVNYLLKGANHRFRTGQEPARFQVIVEEAHNLFSHGRMATEDPWVRIAKEGAKYGIGLMYATQEVSSIDKRILANTHNWVVAHLNSNYETEELSHYYDFSAYAASILKAEEVGFVRLKTYSSPYIVPTQVHKFDAAMIAEARRVAGLAPLA